MAVTADDRGQPAMQKSNLLFSSQLSDSAEEEDSADLKKAQKGELREVPGHLWGRREVGHLSPQPLTLRAYGGSPGSGAPVVSSLIPRILKKAHPCVHF